ncbi:MAG: threonine synthase [Balneolaceae bacterium]|jgi:threonine synthase
MASCLSHLECSRTGKKYRMDTLQNLSDVGAPLLARYDFEKVCQTVGRKDLSERREDMWRYAELLPVHDAQNIISMGEGFTPLLSVKKLREFTGFRRLFVKDEALNPTGSFKARGQSSALSAAIERGARKFAIPSAGNAAGAMAAYAAQAGCEAHVFMPEDTPEAFKLECEYYGAAVELIEGVISDCGKIVASRKDNEEWYEVSTLKEPYRLEGKKTMGFELAEQFGWELPDVIIYPTGGGTGLIGMWKAFEEMEQLGWIDEKRPRMISVQAEGCAPIVRAFEENAESARIWEHPYTVASGLRVPGAVGDFLILDALRTSGGTAVSVSDDELMEYSKVLARNTGIFPAPEGGATLAALMKLEKDDLVDPEDRIVLFNTGTGFKYLEVFRQPETRTQGQVS